MSTAATKWQEVEQQAERQRMPSLIQDRTKVRFVWQCAEDVPHVEVLGGIIERCRVTPIVKKYVWDNIDSLAQEQRVPGMMRRDREGKFAEAAYEILPGYIFDSVMDQYGHQGVVELASLREVQTANDFQALNIDGFFFPQRKSHLAKIDDIPRTYSEMRAQIEEAKSRLQTGNLNYTLDQCPTLLNTADEMLDAVRKAEAFDVFLLDESERELELGRTNPTFKQLYDNRDIRALHRLQRQRKDYAINEMAKQHNSLVELMATTIAQQKDSSADMATIAATVAEKVAEKFAAEFAKMYTQNQVQSAQGYDNNKPSTKK